MNHVGQIHLLLGCIVFCTGVRVECKQGRGVSQWLLGECDFWTGRQGETPGTCPWPSSSTTESLGKVTHPLISTAPPKHAGYLGSLRIDLRLKKRMQSQGNGKQAAKPDHKVSLLSWIKENTNLWLPWASKNSSSELSSESRAILCILHSEMLWRDGLAAIWHKSKTKNQNKKVIFGHVLVLCLFYTHIDTVTKKRRKKSPSPHTQKVLYKHVTGSAVYGFTTDGVFYGQGGAWKMWSIMTDKLKASTAKSHLKKTAIGARL